jgi:hypothetical protein
MHCLQANANLALNRCAILASMHAASLHEQIEQRIVKLIICEVLRQAVLAIFGTA